MRRKPLRITKAYDEYTVKTGSAGFVCLYKNGKRIQPKHYVKTFKVKKEKK